MTTSANAGAEKVWAAIEVEKRRDRLVRRVSVIAWSVTFVLLLALGVMVGFSIVPAVKAVLVGALPWVAVYGLAMPFIIVLGIVSLLIASLSTVGVFLRMRTTTLSEVQLRLAALEQVLATRRDAE
ncbi:MAG TPA: hypothetical protein VGL65_10200 [Gemmatimonadales bacterium]|jgi:hypothetical protein